MTGALRPGRLSFMFLVLFLEILEDLSLGSRRSASDAGEETAKERKDWTHVPANHDDELEYSSVEKRWGGRTGRTCVRLS